MANGSKIDKAKSRISSREKKNLIFYISLMAYPILQFIIFYIYVNFNSIKLAFFSYQAKQDTIGYITVFDGFKNITGAWKILTKSSYMVVNSLKNFGIGLCTGFPLAIIFSFYIYKKYPLSGFYRVILFMPQIISGLIMSILFKELVNNVYPQVVQAITGVRPATPLHENLRPFGLVIFFNVWMGFGVNTMMISNAMSGISNDIVEAVSLDGANIVQEFWYITLPSVYSTLTSLFIIMMTGLFTDQMNLYNLFGDKAEPFGTLGYYLYKHARLLSSTAESTSTPSISELSAIGLILTLIMVPLTLVARKLFNRFGPSEEREGKGHA